MYRLFQQIGQGLRTIFLMLPGVPISSRPSLNLAVTRALALVVLAIGLSQSPVLTAVAVIAIALVFSYK
jgi:hypothetical protein